MRKSYSFKKLGLKIQRLAAIMLVTLMAVGNVFAEYDGTGLFTQINSLDELTSGYYVVTGTEENGDYAMLNTASGYINATTPVFFNPPANIVWRIDVDADGNVTFFNEEAGKYVEYHGTGNKAYLVATASEQSTWTPSLSSTGWVMTNVANTQRILSYNYNNGNNPRFAGYGGTQKSLALYKQGPVPAVMAPTFNIPSGTYYTAQTVELSCLTPGANIYYTVNGGEPILYNAPFTVSTTSLVSAYATLGDDNSLITTLAIDFPLEVSNIAALLDANADNTTVYNLTGDVQFVWRHNKNVYVQDATGGLLVFDDNNKITTEYTNGDIISGGVYGTLKNYKNMLEFVPTQNTAPGTPGTAILPVEATVAQIMANPEAYMHKLVVIRDGYFTPGTINSSNRSITFNQGENTITVYNQFYTLNSTFAAGNGGNLLGFVGQYNSTTEIFPRNDGDLAAISVPFTCDFNDGDHNEWTLVNGTSANKWYIGEPAGFQDGALYISSSNGATNKYNVTSVTDAHAYIYTTLPASDLMLTFDLRTVGESDDYLQVSVLDEAPTAGTLPATYLARYYNVNEFTTQSVVIPASYAGAKYIVFTWHNDNAVGVQTPAAIDNVTLNATCTTPTDLAATVTGQTATVTWTAPAGQTAWTLEYKAVDDDAWQSVNATSTTVTLNDLATNTDYNVRVKAVCGEESSLWTNAQFNVPCQQLTESEMEITIGTGTGTTNIAPANAYYKNSWTQMVYPASNFETPGYINAVSWYVNAALTHNYDYFRIYVGTKATATNTSTTDWVSMDDLTLVYESTNGTLGSTAGWETYTFNTPYYYNGEGNLVIVTARTAQAYNSVQYRYTSATNGVLYRRSDSSPESYGNHPGSNTGVQSSYLPNMLVDYTGSVCGDLVCAAPTALTVSDVTTDGAELAWEGDATSYVVSYKATTDDEWATATTTTNAYTLTGLNQNTEYMVRVKGDCSTIGQSTEAAAAFTTEANCPAPQNLTATAVAHTVNVNWLPVNGVNAYEVHVTGNNADITLNVTNASQTNLTGLAEGAAYTIAVRAICGEGVTSDWSTINFTMPTICPAPTGLAVTDKGQNTAKVTWNAGNASAWTVEYGYEGFTLGTGTQVNVTEATVTLTGLNAYSTYEVYVKADCGLGYESNWSSKLTFTTECGPITITAQHPWTEGFESYTGSDNLAFDNCWATPEMSHYNSPFIYRNYSTAAHTGKNSAELKGDNGEVSTLVFPAFTNPLADLQFTYYGMVTGTTPGTMQLGYVTDPNDASTFVEIQVIPAQSGSYNRANSLEYGPFFFTGITDPNARIALRFTSATSNCSWNLDDFMVRLLPNCIAPGNLAVSAVTNNTATLSWTENGDATAWNIEYGPAGFTQGTGTVVAANANPFTVNGLAASTTYDFYVQSNCGMGDLSEWTASASTTTKCDPILVTADNPWFEDFEGYQGSGEQPFICWETPVKPNGPFVYCGYSQACHSGQNSAEFKGSTNVLVLPAFANNTYDLQVSFWASRTSSSYGTMEVGYLTDLTDMTTFVPVSTTPGPSTRNGVGTFMGTYMFPFSTPANARIALRYTSTSSTASWNLDDFTVSLAPSCRPSSNLTVSDVTTNSASVTWTPGGNEHAWNLQYKASSSDVWTTVNATTSTVALSNLAYSTEYSVRVKPACADETMEWLTGAFTTECATFVPGIMDLVIGNGTSTSYYPPMCNYYNNSYAEMIYPASELGGAGTITALSFEVGSSSNYNYSSLKIYLGTRSSSTYSSTSDWTTFSDLTLVYSRTGGSVGSATGWETYTLDTPYEYNGTDNLVVVVSRRGSAWTSSLKYKYTNVTNSVLYKQQDAAMDYEFPEGVTGTQNYYRPNIKINISGLVCGDEHCADPTNLVVSNVTATGATLTWNGGDATAWRVGYKTADATEWTSVEVTNNTYTLTNLISTTNYDVRVKTLCTGDESNYITASLTTPMIPTALPYATDFSEGGWMLNNSTSVNKWMMGTPSNKSYSALYISNDGSNAAYTVSSACVVSAEKLFAMPADDSVRVSFDVEVGGESSYDYLKVFLAPSTSTYPAAASSSTSYSSYSYSTYAFDFSNYLSQTGYTSYPYKLNLTQGNIIHVDMKVANPAPNGQGKLVFAWKDDTSGGTQPGAVISNLMVGDAVLCAVPVNLVATPVENGSSTITWEAGGEETSWIMTLTPNTGDAITVTLTEPTYTVSGMQPGDSYEVSVKADCGAGEESAEVTTTVLCPALVDIALVDVYTNPSNCDLTDAVARITVKNMLESPISTFEAYYKVNNGDTVHETVTLTTPMNEGETYVYTFATAPVFTENASTITAWVEIPSETATENNQKTSGITYLTTSKDLPYLETFSSPSASQEWFVVNDDNDDATFAVSGTAIRYNASDENAANDWIISPCFGPLSSYQAGAPAEMYLISYDYKANSAYYTEAFTTYFNDNMGFVPEHNYLVSSHSFNNTDYVTYRTYFITDEGEELDNGHILFHAESAVGTAGFSIDNVSVKKAMLVGVQTTANGTVSIENSEIVPMPIPTYTAYVVPMEEVMLVMTPDAGYHVGAVYVSHQNGSTELLRGENTNNAAIDYCAYVPAMGDMITVTFVPNQYNVNATVTNVPATGYNNNAPGAVYTPNHEVVAHGAAHNGTFTMAPYFSFDKLYVNGMDYTAQVTNLGNGQYGLTLDPVMEDKDINVLVSLDSATVTYTVNGGKGTINGVFEADATNNPVIYTVTVEGYGDLLSTITPAPGYHVENIIIDGVEHTNIDIYSFEHLIGHHTVEVTFAPNHYVITTTAFGEGTVAPGAEFDYDPDYTYTFTATPATGYSIATITLNNVALTVADPSTTYTETLTNILDNYDYVVTFAPSTYTVAATCGNNGTISPLGTSSYLYHQNATYTINAAPGYYIASVTVDGTATTYTQADALTTTTYTFNNVDADHTISATFAQFVFTVTVNAGAHGAIAPATSTFAYGATPTFTITPDAGYGIVDVTVDGTSIGAVASYTFLPLDGDHVIAATFAANIYTIAATAGNGGTITPAGNTTVAHNGNQTYTISANSGYHVSDVFVDGASVGAVTTYTFTGVTANHTIYAAFESNEYTVTVNQPAHGTIAPGTTTVLYGATPSFVITPTVGYSVTAITVNGTNVTLANVPNVNGIYTYTFAAINANQTLTATMTAKTYTITASAGANGSITPNGNTTVNYGAAQAYTITPANGYVIDNVTVDNISMGAVSSYVFTNVTANHTIAATFKAAECEVPTFMYTTHIDETSAELHWSHPTATTFDIQYKTATSNYTSVGNVSGNSYQLTNLTPNTTYMWQVRAHCAGNNLSEWTNLITFTTDANTIDGIEDLVKSNIKVYAEHQNVHILNNEGMNIENVRIFDAYGKMVYSGAVSTSHEVINLNVAAGAYIVNVTTDEGVANYKVTILK